MVQDDQKKTAKDEPPRPPRRYVAPALVRLGHMTEVTEKSGANPDAPMPNPTRPN